MNSRGSGTILVLMLGVTFFFLGLALAPALIQVNDEQRIDADCANTTDAFILGGCTITDLFPGMFVGLLFGLGGAVIGGKVLWD